MHNASEKPVMPRLLVALIPVPLLALAAGEIFQALYNPSQNAAIAVRIGSAFKPVVYLLSLILIVGYIIAIRRILRPLFARLDGHYADEAKARNAAMGIPGFLILANIGFWTVGTLVFYAINGWKAPLGTPLGWALLLKISEGLVSAILSALLVNLALIDPKRRLRMETVRENERDLFVENEESLILVSSLFLLGTRFAYFGRYFLERDPAAAGPKSFLLSSLVISLIVSGIALLLLVLSRRERRAQLDLLVKRLGELADGKGVDLSVSLELLNFDGIGVAMGHFNSFAVSLRGMISEVRDAAAELERASGDLTKKSGLIEEALAEIARSIGDMSGQIEVEAASAAESAKAVRSIDASIEALHGAIGRQTSSVADSSASVEEMISSVAAVAGSVERVDASYATLLSSAAEGARRLDEVGGLVEGVAEKSRRLSDTNRVIAGIAAKTNLLAMNAAIEAAHAGAAGAGFSVVADEIRALAIGSAAQSKDVTKSLSEMQNAVGAIVAATASAKEGFERVSALITEVNHFEEEIRSALAEQTKGGRLVSEALASMQSVTGEVRSGADAMAQAGKAVFGRMDELLAIAEKSRGEATSISRETGDLKQGFSAVAKIIDETMGAVRKLNDLTRRFKV